MIKKLISITCALTLLLCVFVSPANAATGWQGYAVYRDGVAGVLEWHSAIMDKATKNDVYPVVHAVGYGTNVQFDSWSNFMSNKGFMGVYRPSSTSMTSAKRDAVTATARRLAADFIGYTASGQMDYNASNNPQGKTTVQVSDIVNMRCDGVVEYSYEFNGVKVYGTSLNWDISKWSVENYKHHCNTNITPSIQATQYMTVVAYQ